jgi:hypothetical protein
MIANVCYVTILFSSNKLLKTHSLFFFSKICKKKYVMRLMVREISIPCLAHT